jgi:hypothetical protein
MDLSVPPSAIRTHRMRPPCETHGHGVARIVAGDRQENGHGSGQEGLDLVRGQGRPEPDVPFAEATLDQDANAGHPGNDLGRRAGPH